MTQERNIYARQATSRLAFRHKVVQTERASPGGLRTPGRAFLPLKASFERLL
jgi:hypothetical protein